MQPLYLARIEDLRHGDLVKVDCAACHHVAVLAPDFLLRLGCDPGTKVLDLQGQVRCRSFVEHGDERWFRSSGGARAGDPVRSPLPPVDPQHRNSVDFAALLGRPDRNTIRYSSRNASVGATHRRADRGRSGRRVGGTSPTPLPGSARHAAPGAILYAFRVNKMSLARARLAAPTSAQVGSLPSDNPACARALRGRKGRAAGRSSAELGGGHPDAGAARHTGLGPTRKRPNPVLDPTRCQSAKRQEG
jgi:hypothetical protein